MNILVLMGGMSAEREISLDTGHAVAEALETAGHTVTVYDLSAADGRDVIALANSPQLGAADVVFIALHGGEGEDGRIQALLDLLGVAYTGSGVCSSAVCMDKSLSKAVFEYHGIATPAWRCLKGGDADLEHVERAIPDVGGFPLVIKPVDQGSTIGISIVRQAADLKGAIDLARRYSPAIVLERYIEGRELSVPIVGDEVYPVVEVRPKGGFYDYKRKYTKGMTEYLCPAPIAAGIAQRIERDAMKAFLVLGCEGFARVDLRLGDDGVPYFLEVNTIPGMTETSLVPMGAEARGISFPDLCDRIVNLAITRAGTGNRKGGG